MKEKIIRYSFIFFVLAITIIQFSITSQADGNLKNDLLAWGFRRGENHKQPVLDSESLNVSERYDGIAMGNNDNPYIYLTFDCGYEAGYTDKILEILKDNDVNATFFITAHYLNTAESLVKKMIQYGNTVGNHTVNHAVLPNLSDDDVKKEITTLQKAVYEATGGYEMTYFRPPRGEFSERTANIVKELGLTSVLWSNAYDDWDTTKQGRSEYGKNKVLDNLHNGAIILLHSTSSDNVEMLDSMIKEAKNMGYEFKGLDEYTR